MKKGLDNWMHFETKAGLEVYTVYRSLIASCTLHRLNPYDYFEEVLRLVRHWPVERILELAPRHWPATRAALNERFLRAIDPPWRRTDAGLFTKAA